MLQARGRIALAQMGQHQNRRLHQSGGIGETLSSNIRRGAVNRFEDGVVIAHIGARHDAETAYEACRQIGDDIAVQIRQEQNIEGLGAHHQLHARVIDNQLVVLDLGEGRGDFAAALEEQAVAELHDVGFVNGANLTPAVAARVFESRARDAHRGVVGDDFEAFDDTRDDFVFQPGVQVFGILTKDGEVDRHIVIARFQTRKHAHGPEIGIEAELLAKLHVDALMASADRSGGRALQSDSADFEGSEDFARQQFAVFFERAETGFDTLPFNRGAGGVDGANGGFGHFGADAVAGNKGYLMGHSFYYKGEVVLIPDWEAERRAMVESQLHSRGIRDERVLRAMALIPREEFVPSDVRVLAYGDEPVPIGYQQTISQPYMTALMTELLELTGRENVLDIGTGSGYLAAVLGALSATVVTVELISGLAQTARRNLERTGRDSNVLVITGDGSFGYPQFAPYDAITVAAAAPEIPPALLEQLNDPGRLVIPVGERTDQELRVIWKRNGQMETRTSTPCRFVPLRGQEGWK